MTHATRLSLARAGGSSVSQGENDTLDPQLQNAMRALHLPVRRPIINDTRTIWGCRDSRRLQDNGSHLTIGLNSEWRTSGEQLENHGLGVVQDRDSVCRVDCDVICEPLELMENSGARSQNAVLRTVSTSRSWPSMRD